MKIGFLLPANFALDSPGNGVRRQAIYQAEALRRAGHQVEQMYAWQHYPLEEFDVIQFFSGGFPHFWIERTALPNRALLVFAPIIDSNEPNWRYRLASAIRGGWTKVYSIPGVLRSQAEGAGLVVCRSQSERARVISGLRTPASKAEVVLNGVSAPVSIDAAEARRKFGLPAEFALHVSIYTQERKNAVRLVEAIGPTGIPLVLAGTATPGPVLDRLKALAERYRNVTMLGFLDAKDLASMYAACKLFCLPSEHEGTGLAALEAASYGARVVITRNGGTADYFRDFAKYVDPLSVTDIRAAIERAWNRPASDALRQHVVQNLTWDQSACQLVTAYRRHIKAKA
jgi:glycosyltransferase involved in cell wall biosynthesis